MNLTLESISWRVAMALVLFVLLQASSGNAWFGRRRRRPPRPTPVKCSQPDWSSWSKCSPFCDVRPMRERYRHVITNNKCVRETLQQRCSGNGGCAQNCIKSTRKCACFSPSMFILDRDAFTWMLADKNNPVRETLQQRCPGNGGCAQNCIKSTRKCACFSPSMFILDRDAFTWMLADKNNPVRETLQQRCPGNGGCAQNCIKSTRKCACFSPSMFILDRDGKTCIDKDECNSNGGRGPCSHSCQNTIGGYTCLCGDGYRINGPTECVLQDCGSPIFSSCPGETAKERNKLNKHNFDNNLPLCAKIKYVCGNGTKYNARCTLCCPQNYRLALKDKNQAWTNYSAFHFNTPSNSIMCHVVGGDTVKWHTQLDKYVCRRSNDPPLSIELVGARINESQPSGTVVGLLNAVDAQHRQQIVYSAYALDGKPLFRCRGDVLESLVTFAWKPKGANSYPVLIRAQDSGFPRMWIEREFNVTVRNVEDAPRNIEISRNSVYENATNGTVVGTLSAIDDDVSQERSSRFSWKLMSNSENFEIFGADVSVKKVLNYDFSKVHYIKVRCSDSSKFSETDLLIYVINSIDPPTLSLTGNTIPENSKLGTVIGQIEAKSESNSDITFTLSASNARVQNKLALSPIPFCLHHQNATKFNTTCYVNLTVSGDLDYEDQKQYIVKVLVKNKESSNFKKWNLSIQNVNEAPDKLELDGMTQIPEAAKSGDDFCLIMVSDPDNKNTMNQIHVCRVVNQGGDGQYFQVNDDTNALQVKVNKTLNYERQQAYHVSLTCTDNGTPPLSITQDVIINVTDTDEPIQNISLSNNQIWENAKVGTEVGILNAYDPDVHRSQRMTFSIVDTNDDHSRLQGDGHFRLQGDGGQVLTLDKPVNFEEDSVLVVTIRVNDTGGSFLQWPFQINVKDVNERPTDILLSSHTMNENLVQGSLLSNITMVDEDENTMTSCEILQDGQGRISVNGTMLIAGATSTNYEEDSSMILGISLKCCDQFGLCVTKNFSIEIKDVNEPPTDIIIMNLQVVENQKDILIGNITVDDPDGNQTHLCALSNETEKEYFKIIRSGDVQMLYLIKELDFEQESVKRFKINCREVGTVSAYSLTKQFDLNVIDINEAPTKGCFKPFSASPEQSPGTVIGYLNVTDPDNEVSNTKDQAPCQQKQHLRYTISSKHEDLLLPFRVADGYFVKTGEIQVNKTYRFLIFVEDDGIVSSLSSAQTVYNKITIHFNCTVISTTLFGPQMTLSGNQIDERSENGTIIGYLNTTAPTHINNSYYGNKKYEYQLVKERCNSYPFVVVDNELRLKFDDARRARPNSQGEIPNYVIIQVKSDSSGWGRFMILVKNEKMFRSWICFSNAPILRSEARNAKLGPIRILNDTRNSTETKSCPQEDGNDNEFPDQSNYICDAQPSFNNSSPDFGKVNLTNRIYVDREMFLRIDTSLDDVDLELDKLVVFVLCWDPRRPLHLVRGNLTVFLQDCSRMINEGGKKVCPSCRHRPCKETETCVDLDSKKYECKPTENTCEATTQERDTTSCAEPSTCPKHSLCSKMVNITQRCIGRSNQLFIALSFSLRPNSYCKFEKCLQEILGNQGSSCVDKLNETNSDQVRQKRDTKKEFSVEVLDVKLPKKMSLVIVVVWKIVKGELQLTDKSSLLLLLKNTNNIVYIKTLEDCALFQGTEIECPITKDSNSQHSAALLKKAKYQAILGVGVAIGLIVIVIVVVFCLKKTRDKKKQLAKRPSTCPVMGDFNNFAFDGNEMDAEQIKETPNDVERQKGPQKENKQKKGKPKHNFNNPVYEEPRQLKTIKKKQDKNTTEVAEYSEPEFGAKSHPRQKQSMFNPFYAASDIILVDRPEDQSNLSGTKVNKSKAEVVKTNAAIDKYPYYEELPPIKYKDNKSDDKSSGNQEAGTIGPHYYVLESTKETAGQGDNSNSNDNKEKSSPHYFVLEQQTSPDKQYQSLHRELAPPSPKYESYRLPQKSGAKDNDQAAKARVYDEPFLGKPELPPEPFLGKPELPPEPKVNQDSPYTEIWKE